MEKLNIAMSKIGMPCRFNIWKAAVLWGGKDSDVTVSSTAAAVGKALEPVVMNYLRDTGWQVEQPADDEFYELHTEHCVLRGRPDCFISKGEKQNVLADIKTMNARDFKYWKANKTSGSKPQFKTQLNLYAEGAKKFDREIEHLAVVAMNKDDNEIAFDIFDLDETEVKNAMRKAEEIYAAGERSITVPGSCWQCGFCANAIKAACPKFINQQQADNEPELGHKVIESDDPELDRAIKQLQEARREIAKWRNIETDTKDYIDRLVLDQGADTVYSGSLILRLTEIYSQRFDLKKFKAERQELLSDYMTTQRSLVYKIKDTGADEPDVPF